MNGGRRRSFYIAEIPIAPCECFGSRPLHAVAFYRIQPSSLWPQNATQIIAFLEVGCYKLHPPLCSDPDEHVKALNPPFLFPQQALDPLVALRVARLAQANLALYSFNSSLDHDLCCVVCSLCEHACCFRHGAIERQFRAIRQRRVKPWRMEIEERNDEDE